MLLDLQLYSVVLSYQLRIPTSLVCNIIIEGYKNHLLVEIECGYHRSLKGRPFTIVCVPKKGQLGKITSSCFLKFSGHVRVYFLTITFL